jgi:hypothetical protein
MPGAGSVGDAAVTVLGLAVQSPGIRLVAVPSPRFPRTNPATGLHSYVVIKSTEGAMNEGDRIRLRADGREGAVTGIAERNGRTFHFVEFDGTTEPATGRSCAADELELLA